ncbi:hypothetical protein [Rhodococcus tibetensis]|uniref:Phage-related minor tail protein n=1 Tax=Rhodococcus tibetensis TaxID=2965064 RepID=A0ABT1QFN8_9NOCA|nr:hypothetical protein [Rhodococcus sp. FXJ9.536]MCQ4119890.1 hypothetical protein [Rhodococcus sp. FXJ9.536]
MAESIGWATLQVIPSMDGVAGRMDSQLVAPMRTAGQAAGRAAGQGVASGIEAARAAVDKATSVLAKSQDKIADATGKRAVAEKQLQALVDKGVTDAGRLAAATEKIEAARRRETAAAREAEKATRDLAAAEERAATATDEVAGSAERVSGGFRSMFSGLGGGTKQLLAFGTGMAGVAGAADLMGKAMDQEKSVSKLNASLGASGQMAADFGAAAKSVFSSGVGESIGEISSAVGLVQSSFATLGFEGDATLEQATTRAVNFANVFDTDIASSVQAASTLVTQGLAKDSTEAFDLLTKSFQTVPAAMRDELPEIIQEYGTNFRALGFDGQESFNLLVAAAGQGKFALDKTGDALKEFTIRGSDMSKSSVGAYEAIGLNAEEMANKIAAGGDGAQEALQRTASGLLTITDPAERANAAIALFGTPLEDLSVDQIPAFLQGLAGAPDAMANFAGATDAMGDTLNDNAASKLETFKRGIESSIVGVLGDQALPMMSEFTGSLEENEGSMLATIAGMTGMGGALAGFEQAKGVFDSAKEGVLGLKDGFLQAKDTAQQAWSSVQAGAGWAKSKASAVASFVHTSASATVEAVKTGAAWTGAQAKAGAGWAAAKLSAVGTFIAMSVSATVEAAKTSAAWVASNTRTAASFVISRGAMVATTIATGAMTAAQWLLNAALSANPIGIIIVAVAALAAGLIYFFTQTEIGRQIISAAWSGIQAAISFAWESVIKPIFDLWWAGMQEIGDVALWLWNSAIVPAFNGVRDVIGGVATWVGDRFNDIVGFVTSMPERISSAASGMWDGIKNAFKSAINWILERWNSLDFSIPSVEIAGVKFGGFTLGVPDIPLLSGGGVAGRRKNGQLFGPGTGTSDSILGINELGIPTALVSDEEGVVKKTAMDNGGAELVAALNAGWTPTADDLHGMFPGLPRYANGTVSVQDMDSFARPIEGVKYAWGGWGNGWLTDCSGAAAAVANYAVKGLPAGEGQRFATGTQGDALAALGAQTGLGPPGSLSWGWYNGGPYGGHTGLTLPSGVNVEMGGSRGNGQFGGQAAGANDPMFTDHAFIPPSFFKKDLGSPNDVREGDVRSDAGPAGDWSGTTPPAGSTVPSSPSSPSTTPGASSTEPAKAFSARDRYKSMFTDIGGIWADASIEMFGMGDWLDLADRYTIKDSSGTAGAPGAPAVGGDTGGGDPNIIPMIEQAKSFLKGVGLFDTGGVWEPGTFGFNGLHEPEHVLKDAHWKVAEGNMTKLDELVGAGVGGGPRVQIINNNNQTIADQASWQRDQANRTRIAMMRYGGGN